MPRNSPIKFENLIQQPVTLKVGDERKTDSNFNLNRSPKSKNL